MCSTGEKVNILTLTNKNQYGNFSLKEKKMTALRIKFKQMLSYIHIK